MLWNTMPSNPGFMAASLCFSRRALDRGDDLVVGAAAAEVARHVLHDLLSRRAFRPGKQRRRGHDLARLAVAALRHLLGDPRFLQRMIAVGRQPFDGGDSLSLNRRYRSDARSCRHAVDVHRACAALRHAAAELGSGETELVADDPQQRGIGRLVGKRFPAVDGKRDHSPLPKVTRDCNHGGSKISFLEAAMNAPAQAGLPALPLKDPKLFREQCYVDGQWVGADSRKTVQVIDPATGQALGTVPDLGAAETRRAIAAAERAWPAWRAKTAKERAVILRKWFDLMMANQDDLAQMLTAEQGKPLSEARGEIAYGASFIEWFAEEGKRAYGDTIPSPWADKRILVIKQPIGVSALITPWNFPNAMSTRKGWPLLAAGCTVVLKPAGKTPYSALAMAELGERAGIPKGVFNVITGNSRAIGGELCANPAVRKLSFTGSTETGRTLMKQCADTIKKLSLELGGNAPFIVFDDANLDAAVEGSIASKYRNA